MSSPLSVLSVLGRLGRGRAALLVALMFLNSLLEGVGLATLVPLFALLLGQQGGDLPPLAQQILAVLQRLGLPADAWLLASIAAGLLVVRELAAFAIQIYAGFTITEMAMRLRRELLAAIMEARADWFHDQRLGGMAVSLAHFTTNAALAMEWAVTATAVLLRTLTYILLVVLISPLLAALIAATAAALYGPLLLLVRLMQKYSGKYAGSTERLGATFADLFASIKVFKAMGLERAVHPIIDTLIRKLRRYRRRVLLASHGLTAAQNIFAIAFVFGILFVAVSWLGISVVEVGMVAALIVSIAKNLARAQKHMQIIAEQAPYLDKVEALIASARAARERTRSGQTPRLEEGIELKDVHFSHGGGREVLKGISLQLPARRISVLRGPSGAGKTTISDLVTGLVEPDAGEVRIDGVPLNDIDLAAWRRMIGYVPQELILLSGTVRDNLTLGEEIADDDIWRALELAGAAAFVRKLPEGLDTDLGERGVKLSGGQRQRLSLARALVRRPRVLILDEVTSALDPETERRLVEGIAELAAREGLTVIAITHTAAWQKVADRLYHLQDGRIAESPPQPA